jgi:pyruvate/2-oxoglutarate dehydrogenase complex dihydrolipoamide acyltransferase (E2) component
MASEDRALNDEGRTGSGDENYAVLAGQADGESGGPDLQLDVPSLSVEEIELEVEDLQVHLSIQAELADLVKINIGLDAELGEAKLGIKGVEAQVQLKARLDNVRDIFSEVLASLQHSPQFFRRPSETATTTEADDALTPSAQEETGSPQEVAENLVEPQATEAAARRARELGVDLSSLQGTGAGGRIVVRDVTRAAEG